MRIFGNRAFVATLGAAALPLGILWYLSNLPGGGRDSAAFVLAQVGIGVVGFGLFALMLGRFVEQVQRNRVRRWIETDEGQAWLLELPEAERDTFLARLEGTDRGEHADHDGPADAD